MPAQGCITAELYVDGQPLKEYSDPEREAEDDHRMTRYVEVKAGQRFSVKVALLPGFQFFTASDVRIEFYIDQNHHWQSFNCPYESVVTYRAELQHREEVWFHSSLMKDEFTGQWVTTSYGFGPLAVDGDAPLPENLTPSDIDLLGSLRVSVYRAKKKTLYKPYVWDGSTPKPLDEISERALKGKAIKHNVK
ncbi:hypothetical protein G647_05226 [Cladophialophora carrionii CBS 160.54]|uniref:DUF7918 domain-containing protein n=1 Tax=Cladophialophora carrionii CBS 160.54 TaxID=1279043 RepID=V9D946_9EURO|nr:uncharacterized protein G647_05226 [Cladophialophora carrionii CBS 160.54]ETI23424.1 hypothetical protein G647_05226 [Cladophialophora carrionii CBS 160.54]